MSLNWFRLSTWMLGMLVGIAIGTDSPFVVFVLVALVGSFLSGVAQTFCQRRLDSDADRRLVDALRGHR